MKKNSIATLLVLVISSFALFAVVPTTSDTFDVSTVIQGVNVIKIAEDTAADVAGFQNATDLSSYEMSTADTLTDTPIGYVLTKTNNRDGYVLKLRATQLTNGTISPINYTVQVGSAQYTTAATPPASVEIVNRDGVEQMVVDSYSINVQLNASDAANATQATYNGTVYVEYYAQ
ncbi:MAG: hypothetical protein AB7D92_02335 [Sphaerochaeta sp.]